MQEHCYDVVENSNRKPSYTNTSGDPEDIYSSPYVPKLLRSSEAYLQRTDTSPLYQDVNELSDKPSKKMVDCHNSEQQCYEEVNDLKNDNGIVKLHTKKVNLYANLMCIYF